MVDRYGWRGLGRFGVFIGFFLIFGGYYGRGEEVGFFFGRESCL